jgi:hypothetical protein
VAGRPILFEVLSAPLPGIPPFSALGGIPMLRNRWAFVKFIINMYK